MSEAGRRLVGGCIVSLWGGRGIGSVPVGMVGSAHVNQSPTNYFIVNPTSLMMSRSGGSFDRSLEEERYYCMDGLNEASKQKKQRKNEELSLTIDFYKSAHREK